MNSYKLILESFYPSSIISFGEIKISDFSEHHFDLLNTLSKKAKIVYLKLSDRYAYIIKGCQTNFQSITDHLIIE